MKHGFALTTVVLTMLVSGGFADAEVLRGNENAASLAVRMLETLGGRAAWAQARTITIGLRGYYAREQEPWQETFWMDLEVPRGRFELSGPTTDRVIAWTPNGGWELSDGSVEVLSEDRHKFELEYWSRQPVVLFHRMATGIPATRVEMGDNEYRFDVFDDESGQLLAQFAVNMKGEPIKWGASIDDREFEHVFGPLMDYDGLRLPEWGCTISGIWRYQHTSASLSASPPAVSFDPPINDE